MRELDFSIRACIKRFTQYPYYGDDIEGRVCTKSADEGYLEIDWPTYMSIKDELAGEIFPNYLIGIRK